MADIIAALFATGVWDTTLLVWTSDNGSPVMSGSNWPLRGLKHSLWEGGTRTPAIVSGGLLPPSQMGKSEMGPIHIVDWYATILGLASLPTQDAGGPSPSDGIDMWPWLSGQVTSSPRNMIVYDHRLYQGPPATGAIRVGSYKLLVGLHSSASWYGGPSNNFFNNNYSDPQPSTHFTACANSPCLFDLSIDPTEHYDIAAEQPFLVAALLREWDRLSEEYHPPSTAPIVVNGFCQAAVASGGFLVPYTVLDAELNTSSAAVAEEMSSFTAVSRFVCPAIFGYGFLCPVLAGCMLLVVAASALACVANLKNLKPTESPRYSLVEV